MTHAVRATGLAAAVLVSTMLATGGSALATPAVSHHRATVVVHATGKHKVAGPTSTRPGVARFSNTGKQAIFLVTPRHGAGKATLARDLTAKTAGKFLKDFVAADTLLGKETTYLRLTRGTYYLADAERNTFTAASFKALRVSGSTVSATVPGARAIVIKDVHTVTAPASIGKTSELRVRNASKHLQEVFLWAVRKDATDAQVNAVVANPDGNDFGKVVTGEPVVLAFMSPGLRATTSRHSAAGRYLVLAYALTSKASSFKLAAGQVRVVTVK